MTIDDAPPPPHAAELTYGGDLTVAEAAVLLGIPEDAVIAWQNRGRLGRVDVDGADGVPLGDVRRLVDSPVRAAVLSAAAELPSPPGSGHRSAR